MFGRAFVVMERWRTARNALALFVIAITLLLATGQARACDGESDRNLGVSTSQRLQPESARRSGSIVAFVTVAATITAATLPGSHHGDCCGGKLKGPSCPGANCSSCLSALSVLPETEQLRGGASPRPCPMQTGAYSLAAGSVFHPPRLVG